jgi:hypothetical protein
MRSHLRADRHLGPGRDGHTAVIQGIGVGGEWGGSVLLSMEWARTSKNRGLLASWPQFDNGRIHGQMAKEDGSEVAGPARAPPSDQPYSF